MMLLIIGANMAGFIFIVACPHLVYINNQFLPKPLRPAMWRNMVMILMMLFCLFFFLVLFGQQTGLWKFKF
jgi:hypothetical protein